MTGSTLQPGQENRRNFDPCRRLACALLAQALKEAAGKIDCSRSPVAYHKVKGGRKAHKAKLTAQARRFLQSNDALFWCEIAGDDFDFEVLQEFIGDPSCIPDGPLGRQANPPSQARNHPESVQPLAVPAWFQEKLG